MVAKRSRWRRADVGRAVRDMESADEVVRGDGVRALCPCHAGWEGFEGHVTEVMRALKDRSRGVRAQALHVLQDAARMQHVSEIDYYIEEAEARLRGKRASRFRPEECEREARRFEKVRPRRRRRTDDGA